MGNVTNGNVRSMGGTTNGNARPLSNMPKGNARRMGALPNGSAQSLTSTTNGNAPAPVSMANGHAKPLGDMTNGNAQPPVGMANGHGNFLSPTTNGHGHSPVSGSGSSGDNESISPPFVEQKRRKQDLTPPDSRAQRRSTISGAPNLGPDSASTHWNSNGAKGSFEQPLFDHNTSRRNSAVEHPLFDHNASRRSSYVPAFSNSPRAVSPEHKRAYSPVSAMRSGNVSSAHSWRHGSPVSTLRHDGIMRGDSPLRGELVSPISERGSPARGVGNIAPNGNAFAQQYRNQQASQQHQAALAALQGHTPPSESPTDSQPSLIKSNSKTSLRDMKRLSMLQTNMPPPTPVREEEEGEEEIEEVISMSPAVRQPVMNYRRSRTSLMLSPTTGNTRNSSQISLSGMSLTNDPVKQYYGQNINPNDLVAVGMEDAFSRL